MLAAKRRLTRFAVLHNGEVALAGDIRIGATFTPKTLIITVSVLLASIKAYLDFFTLYKCGTWPTALRQSPPSLRQYLISFGYGKDLSWVNQVSISDLVFVRFVDHREHHALPQKST